MAPVGVGTGQDTAPWPCSIRGASWVGDTQGKSWTLPLPWILALARLCLLLAQSMLLPHVADTVRFPAHLGKGSRATLRALDVPFLLE